MDVIERRVAWIAITLALGFGFAGRGAFFFSNRIGGWSLFFNISVIVSVAGAAVLLVAALVPAAIHPLLLEQRERLAFYAFALWVLAVLVVLGLNADAIVDAYRHPNSFR
jgi:hypothetical protein